MMMFAALAGTASAGEIADALGVDRATLTGSLFTVEIAACASTGKRRCRCRSSLLIKQTSW
jgi:hypothetical protein